LLIVSSLVLPALKTAPPLLLSSLKNDEDEDKDGLFSFHSRLFLLFLHLIISDFDELTIWLVD